MKKKDFNYIERIGLAIMILGFVFMILNDVWEDNPIPGVIERHQMFLWGGLLIGGLGMLKRQNDNKKNS